MSRRAVTLAAAAWAAVIGVAAGSAVANAPVDYEISVPTAARVVPGSRSSVSLTISARTGYAISRDGPLSVGLSVEPKGGLTLAKTRYRRSDAADARADDPRFDLRFEAAKAGRFRLVATLRFWVCNKRTCRPISETRAIEVRAEPAAPPPEEATPPDAGASR